MTKKKIDKIDLLRQENDIHHALILLTQRHGLSITAFGITLIILMTSIFLINSFLATIVLLLLLIMIVYYVTKEQNYLVEHKQKLKEQLMELDKKW
jgi:type IV secretory pathway VirB3-like protein